MCGIFGYVGREANACQVVLDGLRKLEYRGYDSWGIAVRRDGQAAYEKAVGKIGLARPSLPASTLGMGHTRWATHGGVTQENAHPHLDCTGRLAVIHNGIIENYQELRREVQSAGHRLRSATDTEVVAHLLEDELGGGGSTADSLVKAMLVVFRRLEGLNAIAV